VEYVYHPYVLGCKVGFSWLTFVPYEIIKITLINIDMHTTNNLKQSLINMIILESNLPIDYNVDKLTAELESFNIIQLSLILDDVHKYVIAY
jgi:hypothetical protein